MLQLCGIVRQRMAHPHNREGREMPAGKDVPDVQVVEYDAGVAALTSELRRFRFQHGNLLFQPLHFARLVVLLLRPGQLLLEGLQLLLDDFQAFLVAAVHRTLLGNEIVGGGLEQPA